MTTHRLISILSILLGILLLTGCAGESQKTDQFVLTEVASYTSQWTGLAVAPNGRIFVNFPRWSPEVPVSVAELHSDGTTTPYPNEGWNSWTPAGGIKDRFVCVQSVVVDEEGFLWILDPANPWFRGVVDGAAKLVKVDIITGDVVQQIMFDSSIAPPQSYLNDVRIDTKREMAYITDSGTGALVVVNLKTGESRRVLYDHPSTKSEGIILTIEGHEWLLPDGNTPNVHADGIAMDPEGAYVYYQALTGRTMYRVKTEWLRDTTLTEQELGLKVETIGQTGASDGLLYGPDGRVYISALEGNAVKAVSAGGEVELVVKSSELLWPDSFAKGTKGEIYVTTSLIHRGREPGAPYKIFRIARK
jgi:sugar lactone lactonase YvrE